MSAFSNYVENKLIDLLLRGQTFTPPSPVYVALFTAAPSDAGGGTEVSGNNYSRASVTASLANWAGTQGAGTTSASSGTSGQTSNNAAVNFPTPSDAWGQVTHWAVFDAASSGNMLFWAPLTTPQTISSGNAVGFAIASLTLTVD